MDACYIVNESTAHYAKKSETKGHMLYDSLYVIFKIGKSDRKQFGGCQMLRGRQMVSNCLLDMKFYFEVMQIFVN